MLFVVPVLEPVAPIVAPKTFPDDAANVFEATSGAEADVVLLCVWVAVHVLALARLRLTVPEPPSAIALPVIVNDPLDVRPIVEFASEALLMEPAGNVSEPVKVGAGIVSPLGSEVDHVGTRLPVPDVINTEFATGAYAAASPLELPTKILF
jgi:hypothetical protein